MKKNILIILSDQLRRQALGCYGNQDAETSNIDRLASRAVRFSSACSTYPVCVPFRFTFMTGEYAHNRNVPALGWAMSRAERTLADEFNEGGYETTWIGKWHLNGGSAIDAKPVPRADQGRWQNWLGFEARNDHVDTHYYENDDPNPRNLNKYQTDGLFDLAFQQIEKRDTAKPFCLCLSVEPPHEPYVAPQELQKKWSAREITLPPSFIALDQYRRDFFRVRIKRYYAMIENLDQNVGRAVEYLRANGLEKNTVIVFLADHGILLGEHGHLSKMFPYEESIGIPLIVYDPSNSNNGSVIDDPVCSEDLFPTLLGLAGLKPKHNLPGIDLGPRMGGNAGAVRRDGVYLEFVEDTREGEVFSDITWRGIRTENYKYVAKSNGQPWLLFDLENDSYEMTNLVRSKSHLPEVRRHHTMLANRVVETGDNFFVG